MAENHAYNQRLARRPKGRSLDTPRRNQSTMPRFLTGMVARQTPNCDIECTCRHRENDSAIQPKRRRGRCHRGNHAARNSPWRTSDNRLARNDRRTTCRRQKEMGRFPQRTAGMIDSSGKTEARVAKCMSRGAALGCLTTPNVRSHET